MEEMSIEQLPKHMKTIKIDVRTWQALRNQRGENETFDEVIKRLLDQRTKELGGKNIQAIVYKRKTAFLNWGNQATEFAVEFEYNDVKSIPSTFTLDLKIKKVFFGKRVFNPSIFFGISHDQKHLSSLYLEIYLECIARALTKEFRAYFSTRTPSKHNKRVFDIVLWRQLYYDYSLSQESFVQDIEEPLRLSEEEKPTKKHTQRIKKSLATKLRL